MKNNRLILLMFFIGLSILLYPHLINKVATGKHISQVKEFRKEIVDKEDILIKEELDKVKSCYRKVYYDDNGIHDPFEESNDKLNKFRECMGMENDEIFAAIEIVKLDLIIPIYLGSSDAILMEGIGQVEGS